MTEKVLHCLNNTCIGPFLPNMTGAILNSIVSEGDCPLRNTVIAICSNEFQNGAIS